MNPCDVRGNLPIHMLQEGDEFRLSFPLGRRGVDLPRARIKTGKQVQGALPGVLVFNAPKTANKNFAPKVGIAYSPGTSGETVIRAGFGLAYDVIFDNVGSTAYPPQLSSTVDAENFPNVFTAPFLAKGGLAPGKVASGANLSQAEARSATSS